MSFLDIFNPVYRKARALEKAVLHDPNFTAAVKDIERAALLALLQYAVQEVARRGLVIDPAKLSAIVVLLGGKV